MKKALVLLLVFVFCLSTAYAEDSIWVKETWGRIDREVDCNGHPLLIHAKILEIPERMEACQYFLDNQTENGENLLRVTRNMNSDQSRAFILHVSCRLAVISM